jgi:hypothetical protein
MTADASRREASLFFALSTLQLAVTLAVLIVGSAVGGLLVGRTHSRRENNERESFAVLQGALLGFMALVLAFGLSLALGRYESRRAAVVDDANTIGTTYLRAQSLPEPMRSESLALLEQYTDVELRLTDVAPGSDAADRTVGEGAALQRPLWALAVRAVHADPEGTAPRLYEESLNEMIDQQTVRVAGLANRVPTEVQLLEVVGAAVAMFLLGLHVGALGRSVIPVLLASGLVTMLLFASFDLDRPTRGFIEIPDSPLTTLRASMDQEPAADAAL